MLLKRMRKALTRLWVVITDRHLTVTRFRDLLRIPDPKKLGWNDRNALPMRFCGYPDEDAKTWEDYDEYIKKHYPIRYFLGFTVANHISYKFYKYGRKFYELKCRFIPSMQFHVLRLKGVDPTLKHYTYGYLTPGYQMELAVWACLRNFVENGDHYDPEVMWSDEEVRKEPWYLPRKHAYDEATLLYKWITVDKKIEFDELNKLPHKERWIAEEEFSKKNREMLKRVIDIQDYLED